MARHVLSKGCFLVRVLDANHPGLVRPFVPYHALESLMSKAFEVRDGADRAVSTLVRDLGVGARVASTDREDSNFVESCAGIFDQTGALDARKVAVMLVG